MKQITVHMNASWFPQAETVGTLGYDMIRGNAAYQWKYDPQWLRAHRGVTLSGDCLMPVVRSLRKDDYSAFCKMQCRIGGESD